MRTYSRLASLLSLSAMAGMGHDNSLIIRDMKNASPAPPLPKLSSAMNERELLAQTKRDRKAARRARLAGY